MKKPALVEWLQKFSLDSKGIDSPQLPLSLIMCQREQQQQQPPPPNDQCRAPCACGASAGGLWSWRGRGIWGCTRVLTVRVLYSCTAVQLPPPPPPPPPPLTLPLPPPPLPLHPSHSPIKRNIYMAGRQQSVGHK